MKTANHVLRTAITLIVAAMIIASTYGCGRPQSLEEALSKSDLQQYADIACREVAQLDSNVQSQVIVNGNTLQTDVYFSYSADDLFGSGFTGLVKIIGDASGFTNYLKSSLASDASIRAKAQYISKLEKEYGLKGVTFLYHYLDSRGNVILSLTVTRKGLVK